MNEPKKRRPRTMREILDEKIERWKPKEFVPDERPCPDARKFTRCRNGWHVATLHNGAEEAIERCPEYWAARGKKVDPEDGLKLLPSESSSSRRRTAMVDILKGRR